MHRNSPLRRGIGTLIEYNVPWISTPNMSSIRLAVFAQRSRVTDRQTD